MYLNLNNALDAVERFVNLPAASNLTPKTDLNLIKLIVLVCIWVNLLITQGVNVPSFLVLSALKAELIFLNV